MTKCPAMHSFPGLKISVGCMISLALLPLGGGHHAESISSPCCLLTVAKFGKCLSCMHWDNSSSAPAAQCAGVSSTFLEVGAAAHQALGCITWGKKNPGAVGATLAEAQSDSQKSSNLSKFKRSSTLGRVCYCPGDHMPLTLLIVIWCKQGRGCRQHARL